MNKTMYNLGASWSFEIEFSVENGNASNLFLISQPLCPIVSIDAFPSTSVLEPSCDIYATVHTGIWPPYRVFWTFRHQDRLQRMKFTKSDLNVVIELNSEIRTLQLKEDIPSGSVQVDTTRILSFDGFYSDESASVSSQEFSERHDLVEQWWNMRPDFVTLFNLKQQL